MAYTTQSLIARILTLLRGPVAPGLTQEQLYYEDVRDEVNALLRGKVQDMDLSGRDRRTEVKDVEVEADDIDYRLTLTDVPDFEPVRLEYLSGTANNQTTWAEAKLVPFASWARHFSSTDYVAACIYGSASMQAGQKLKLNLPPETVATTEFRLSYRLPLLLALQSGDRPPLPEDFMPMVEYEGAISCYPLVRDAGADYVEWWKSVLPIYEAQIARWDERWRAYLEKSVEDPVQPIAPFDSFRRAGRGSRSPRAFLPRA